MMYRFWTGLRGASNGTWWWEHNNQLLAYENWDGIEPNNLDTEHCMSLQLNADETLWWININCISPLNLICEIDGKPMA